MKRSFTFRVSSSLSFCFCSCFCSQLPVPCPWHCLCFCFWSALAMATTSGLGRQLMRPCARVCVCVCVRVLSSATVCVRHSVSVYVYEPGGLDGGPDSCQFWERVEVEPLGMLIPIRLAILPNCRQTTHNLACRTFQLQAMYCEKRQCADLH